MAEIIQFSHANGFPALTYKTLLDSLQEQFIVHYIDMLGHNPDFPVAADNWTDLSNELIYTLDSSDLGSVIGVGHSLGGAITLFAALSRPDLFKAIVLLDSPIFAFPKAKIVQWLKKIDRMSWITPGRRVMRRRIHWSSFEEALMFFRSRPLFKNFAEESLRDYVTYATQATEEGRYLRFDPHIEAKIYHTLPHNYSEYKKKLQIPGVALIGKKSDVVHSMDQRNMEKKFNIRCKKVEGGHLFPFEYPIETAMAIKEAISEMLELG